MSPRHERLRSIPHKQASEVTVIDVPAGHGLIAHKQYMVTTACGQQMPTTLVTREDDRVRCEACKTAMSESADGAPSITCPRCSMTSYNPNDIRAGYCGNCHDWTGTPEGGE